MILVILGTQDSPFPRILQQTEAAIRSLKINEKVYAQVGTTPYKSNLMELKDYFLGEEYENLIKKARLIITHGGAGIMLKAIHLQKKVIALARLKKYGEHNDNHQQELVHKLAQLGLIYEVTDNITSAIVASEKFVPQKFTQKSDLIPAVINFIEKEK